MGVQWIPKHLLLAWVVRVLNCTFGTRINYMTHRIITGADNYRLYVHLIHGRFWGRDNPSRRIIRLVWLPKKLFFSKEIAARCSPSRCIRPNKTHTLQHATYIVQMRTMNDSGRKNFFHSINDWLQIRRQLNDTHFLSNLPVKCHLNNRNVILKSLLILTSRIPNWLNGKT